MVKYSKLTEYTIDSDRRATYILKSLTCSKIKATQSKSLLEENKLAPNMHSKKSKEYIYI